MTEMRDVIARLILQRISGWDFWDEIQNSPMRKRYEGVAADVLKAMREPTVEMLLAACRKAAEEQVRPIAIHRMDAEQIWKAMIDAALIP